ncbi:LysR family transcriptional regulator [Belnapia moabensis]|uniref:LysR family transcriptional regulator n=1 Tax=Belnapia moabensis TaxID=365533 RepID=UPI0005BB91C6|nr:LysR family transcriptional regulator [Belnapia moabensis]
MAPILDPDDSACRGIRLRDLRVTLAVMQTGSWSRAADALGITQSAVSHHVSDLERAVGQPLLERGQGGATLTRVGDQFLPLAAEALDLLDQSLREATSVGDPGSGEVRIGASGPYIAGGFLAAAIQRAQQYHPQLTVLVEEADTGALDFRGLRERRLDVVLGRMSALDACADIQAEVLFSEPILVATGAQSFWARLPAVTLRDLMSARWLLGPPDTAIRALVVEAFQAEGLEPPRAAVSTHNMELRMQLLARSDYVTSLPASLLRANGERWGLRALPITLQRPVPA